MRIGILGAGQLGQMLALAGYPLGNRFSFLDPGGRPSADIGHVLTGSDSEAVAAFSEASDLITYEFEHLDVALVEALEAKMPVFPSNRALKVCQHRGEEKALFSSLSIPTPAYRLVGSAAELEAAVKALGAPVVAKSVTEGYDGKGQAVLRAPDEAFDAWNAIGHQQLVVEAFVEFEREVSIIAVRSRTGELAFYPMAENHHHEGILRYSMAPMPDVSEAVQRQAEAYIRALLDALEYVGVLTLELFQNADGTLLANEMAPRVHNSGHWTQDGAVTSQFENHLRAIQGLPLGSTRALHPTCMINLIGKDVDTEAVLSEPDAHLHRYGKEERAGRKIGHINLTAPDHAELFERLDRVRSNVPDAPAPRFLARP
ncbi:5-(carboxyamino)imidazole ribonucleotide synthase [Larsenimonas suaedae]|uniref:N5-carboxyaminoimidazole ribonucleotide synthase n=1 Tax=Larsenimonas suaedae TaxID=1851019 RepID=A0ABU1GWT2_9GAMM|nr:5-(carboxyamino)imidazole ribonucleotide synthase [Larsenimonas suaedae]MCM2973076.1 5-(carboxyamino)imidazole ribonucleotide synthase [Larsenimonas suaedae]MDR5896513.1 5-(carboxyamino)imidazole ribonucleotide synthase [Larsenimonas suaedae]